MEELFAKITEILRKVCPESYYSMNPRPSNEIVYPYLTFDYTSRPGDRNQELATLEIDVFCKSKSAKEALILEDKLKDALIFYRDLSEDLLLVFSYEYAQTIDTQVDNLHRRNITFGLGVWKRTKVYGN